jgi:MoaA/NifB/PqqE/SkfB family radical SAM enzyme
MVQFEKILRPKTTNLFAYQNLTEKQRQNIEKNCLEMERGKTILDSLPQRLVLELTNSCNLSCIMCGRRTKSFQPTFFNVEWLKKISSILDHVTEVTLFGWGEPTVHPKFGQILEYLAQYPVKKYFLTNGMFLDRFFDPVVDTVDILAISLDGAKPDTNDRIRRGADFSKIIENIQGLVTKRKASTRKRPHINIVMTLMKDNLNDLPSMIELAATLGIEEVKAVYLTAFSQELTSQVLFDQHEEVKEVYRETLHLADKNGILVKLPYLQGEDPAQNEPHKPCFVGWRDFFLGSDGFVRPCQSTAQKFFDFHDHTNFMDMWNAIEFQIFRETVNQANSMPSQCSNCYQSSFANWNKRSSFLQNEVSSDFSPQWQR